jgi:hypothetical protein
VNNFFNFFIGDFMKLFFTVVFLISFISCGGKEGDSSDSKGSSGGFGSFSLDTGPITVNNFCAGHSSSLLDSSSCSSISGTYSSISVSSCIGATGDSSDNSCSFGTATPNCVINGNKLALDFGHSYSVDSITACEGAGGAVVISCSGVTESNCPAIGGTWTTQTVQACSGGDVSNESNCLTAGGKYFNSIEYLTGGFGAEFSRGDLIAGDNKIYSTGLDSYSGETVELIDINVILTISNVYGPVNTIWEGIITASTDGLFYGDDYGNIIFNMNSSIGISNYQDSDAGVSAFIDRLYINR